MVKEELLLIVKSPVKADMRHDVARPMLEGSAGNEVFPPERVVQQQVAPGLQEGPDALQSLREPLRVDHVIHDVEAQHGVETPETIDIDLPFGRGADVEPHERVLRICRFESLDDDWGDVCPDIATAPQVAGERREYARPASDVEYRLSEE
jgi:hypothetical protein